VRLRAAEPRDVDAYHAFLSREQDWAANEIYAPMPRRMAEAWIEKARAPFEETRTLALVIAATADDRALGLVEVGPVDAIHRRAAIGINIWDPAERGRGHARAALADAVALAFGRLNVHRLECEVNASNAASLALFERAGFRREGLLRDRSFAGGRYEDAIVLARLARD
jgi:diamine N-acetyltransferase